MKTLHSLILTCCLGLAPLGWALEADPSTSPAPEAAPSGDAVSPSAVEEEPPAASAPKAPWAETKTEIGEKDEQEKEEYIQTLVREGRVAVKVLNERTGENTLDSLRRQSLTSLKQYFDHPEIKHNAYDGHTVQEHARMKVRSLPPFQGEIDPRTLQITDNFDRDSPVPAYTHHDTGGKPQYSLFPIPLKTYNISGEENGMSVWEILCHRVEFDPFNLAAAVVFLLAILHTFMAPKFQGWAHKLEKRHKQKLREERFRILHPEQRVPVSFASTLCHFLGEVEVVFGLWLIPFFFVCKHYYSMEDFLLYIDRDRSFTEPLFVAVVMVIASSRPIYRLAENTLKFGASLGKGTPAAWWISVLCVAPLLGSFITEPAAMTLAAILLGKKFYQLKPSPSLCYATLALLFVNVSVGGTLTHFAAPPIVMVASEWKWGMGHMFMHFGWKAILGITISNVLYFLYFSKEFKRLEEVQRANSAFDGSVPTSWEDRQDIIPVWVYAASIFFLAWTVYFAHHPAIFIGGFMFFLGFTMATPQYQNAFSIKVPMLVAFFLAGLLVMGGVQGWWMQPVLNALADMGATVTMGIASVLTAFNDNASVTYLSSTVGTLPDDIKYAVVAGAVTGGGLTVIANAPNPAGQAILGKYFKTGISALKLFLWALLPTVIVFCIFILIR